MKTFQTIQEGVYDPNIFKAIFLAGGPGSGASAGPVEFWIWQRSGTHQARLQSTQCHILRHRS